MLVTGAAFSGGSVASRSAIAPPRPASAAVFSVPFLLFLFFLRLLPLGFVDKSCAYATHHSSNAKQGHALGTSQRGHCLNGRCTTHIC